jgi:hypothetical protein
MFTHSLVLAMMLQGGATPPTQPKSTAITGQIGACREIDSPEARLACYDKAAGALTDALAQKELVVLDRQQVRETRRSLFGFSLPRLALFGGGDGDDGRDDPEEIGTQIRSLRSLGYGKWVIGLPDGARWQTTDAVQSGIGVGQPITIKKAALGGYFIRFGIRSVRAVRVR